MQALFGELYIDNMKKYIYIWRRDINALCFPWASVTLRHETNSKYIDVFADLYFIYWKNWISIGHIGYGISCVHTGNRHPVK